MHNRRGVNVNLPKVRRLQNVLQTFCE